MKLSTLSLSLVFLTTTSSFGFQIATGQNKSYSHTSMTALQMGFFDFKPVHGSGSANEKDLDEQWRRQQDILAARRGHLDKEHLKSKYKGGEGKFEIHASMAQKKSHVDDMYIDDITHQGHKKKIKSAAPKFKFPWDKR